VTWGRLPVLELSMLHGGYTQHDTIANVTLTVGRGQTIALLGPNGAGKSTVLAAISGLLPRRTGSITVNGHELIDQPSHRIVARGIVQVPEGRRVFAPLSVFDNLRLGSVGLSPHNAVAVRDQLDFVYALFPRLAERRQQLAGTLSGGEQQMVAIGRALMSRPAVLLLDEPFLGLAPLVIQEIRTALDALKQKGLTMLLVEQKLDIALSFAERAYVLIKGRIALEGSCAALAARTDLSTLYFDLSRRQD